MKPQDLQVKFDEMRDAHKANGTPSYEVRVERLRTLEKLVLENQDALVQAMSDDFSHRSPDEARSSDITMTIGDIRHNIRKLKKWMKPRKLGVPKHFLPARGHVLPQPLGVVGVISPWNFPIYLAIPPAVAAIAAGNRVMIKPSELTPKTSQLMADLIADAFDPNVISVILGDANVGKAFSELPFNHLLFTGSTEVGRLVAMAAAKNLTPVTLELGGKSPTVVGFDADIELAAKRIAFGKTCNAGQICVAPDYVLVPRDQMDTFVNALKAEVEKLFPDFATTTDYTAIISDRHQSRIRDMIDEAEKSGENVVHLGQTNDTNVRTVAPVLIIEPKTEIHAMRDEIFGPILPIIPYNSIEEAQKYVRDRPTPLALYIFTKDNDERDSWLENSLSGGVCVNETIFHVVVDSLPFGGVGDSGIGAYHGEKGFETFSHMKSVFFQSRLNAMFLFAPPYNGFKRGIAKLLQKLI